MGVRSSSRSSSRRAQPAPGKPAPDRSSGGAACPPGVAAAASAGARPGLSASSARRPCLWPLPSASQALGPRVFQEDASHRVLPLEGPQWEPPLQSLGSVSADLLRLWTSGDPILSPPAPTNPSFYPDPERGATGPPCLVWTVPGTLPVWLLAQRCWDMRGKAPRNERPQRRSAAPGSAGGVGVYGG